MLKFISNIAERGGTFYTLLSTLTFEGNISVTFTRNRAENGGAISAVKCTITFAQKSQLRLFNNSAARNGGALHLSDHFTANISSITFHQNTANSYGGAIYCDLTKNSKSKITFHSTGIVFDNNTDLTSSYVYVDMPTSCDEMCLNNVSGMVVLMGTLKPLLEK